MNVKSVESVQPGDLVLFLDPYFRKLFPGTRRILRARRNDFVIEILHEDIGGEDPIEMSFCPSSETVSILSNES